MKRIAWFFAFQLLCAAAGYAQTPPDPPLTGFVYVVTAQNSATCQQCQSYGTGVCTGGSPSCANTSAPPPFAACSSPSTMKLLSAHYCDVYPLNPAYCYTYLCFGGGTDTGNVALGAYAGENLESGSHQTQGNTAVGSFALRAAEGSNLFDGWHNTAVGAFALNSSVSGSGDVAVGAAALAALNQPGTLSDVTNSNAALGNYALTFLEQGTANVAVGGSAGLGLRNGSNNIYLGNVGPSGSSESGTIRIGASQTSTFIAGIRNAVLSNDSRPVYVDGSGRLGISTQAAAGERPAATSAPVDSVVRLERRVDAQDERITDLTRALQEQAGQLRAISLRLGAQARETAGAIAGPAPAIASSVSPPTPRRRRFLFWR